MLFNTPPHLLRTRLLGLSALFLLILGSCNQTAVNVEDDIEEAVISYKKPLPGLALPNYRTSLPSPTSIKNDGAVIQQQGTLNWDALEPLLSLTSQQLGNRKWVGLFSIHRPEKAGYEYKAVPLGFSQEVLAEAAGNTRPFFLEYNKTTSDSTHVYGVFIATIPDSDIAEQQLRQAIMGPAEASQKQIAKAKPIQLSSQDRCWEVISGDGGELDFLPTMCVEIVVTAPRIPFPPIDEIWDDEWGPYNWEPSGGGGASNGNENCFIVEGLEMRPCDEGCDGDPAAYLDDCGRCVGGNTGRVAAPAGADCNELPKPCEDLDDQILNNAQVQAKMDEIWNISYGSERNPLLHSERKEKLYVVYFDGIEYDFLEIIPNEVSSCIFRAGTQNIPSGSVALIHTHPYGNLDYITDPLCINMYNQRFGTNLDSLQWFAGRASSLDKKLYNQYQRPIFVLDKNRIRKLNSNSGYGRTYERCGY